MENWVKVCLLLCIYGVIKEFRPSEPFVTKYLANPPMNFTLDEINVEIYPVAIYSSMSLLILVFLLTDIVRYKPIIIMNSIAGIVIYIILILGRSIILIQIAEFFYGFFVACEVAYYTYIYAKVNKERYQEVTGYTRAAYLTGRAISGIIGQIFISLGFTYYMLNYLTLGGMCLSLVWAVLLPSVPQSIYFHRKEEQSTATMTDDTKLNKQNSLQFIRNGCIRLRNDFVAAFTNPYVVKWAIWWALATCGYYQVLSYIQLLWEKVIVDFEKEDYSTKLNGAVEAAYTILSAIAASGFGKLKLDWSKQGENALFVCSCGIGALLYFMSQTNSIWVAYTTYISYTILYHGMITIASSEIAKFINADSHGLVFGFNLFVTLVLQSLLTFIVVARLELDIRVQFVVYSCYFCILGLVFAVKSLIVFCKRKSLSFDIE